MKSSTQQANELKKVLNIIGDKWSALILNDLSNCKAMRFGECQKSEGINPRTLSARLNALEEAGLVNKTEYRQYPPRTEYALTDKGKDLSPIFEQMVRWSKKHLKTV